jgi:hypothetical protein
MAGIFSVFVPQVTRMGAKGMCMALSVRPGKAGPKGVNHAMNS